MTDKAILLTSELSVMPQPSLPLFQDGQVAINDKLSYRRVDGDIIYYNWLMPLFIHTASDHATFRMITAQFCVTGAATQVDMCRAFGVTTISMKRAVKLYRDGGASGFFTEKKCRGPAVLTPDVLQKAQRLLDSGKNRKIVADAIGLKRDTLYKAIANGRLRERERDDSMPTTSSERNVADASAPMGMGATNTVDRVMARLGQLISSVEITFMPCSDIASGGVLCALPALLTTGLLRHAERFFTLPQGYYGLKSIFTLLSFIALLRVKSLEGLRYEAPGEWGKMIGLDRVPEVRTLRRKVKILAGQQIQEWSTELCKDWMQSDSGSASVLYVDGHVRVYHGDQTKLPRHHVAREKLCMRATIDYWVNAMDGQPFFFVNQAVDPGLIKVLENEIIPNLITLVPNQPTKERLQAEPLSHCFKIVFDREGYSPDLFKRLWKSHRIACITYRKGSHADWPTEEFRSIEATRISGERIKISLAERGALLGETVWVREIRKLTSSGKQVAIVTTDFVTDYSEIAVTMFARWSQENFFRYMRMHYGLDSLVDYELEDVAKHTAVVNPQYRELAGKVSRLAALHAKKMAEYGATSLTEPIGELVVREYEETKSRLKEEIDQFAIELAALKQKRKETPKKIKFSELPPEDKFKKLGTKSKHFIDTIKMIAYRAETAMVSVLREAMSREDDGRKLLLSIYQATVDIIPDLQKKELLVRFHHLTNAAEDRALEYLLGQLNATETLFPGTDLKLNYMLVS
jgi:prepilin-type processing-associated H-X9-DG protein